MKYLKTYNEAYLDDEDEKVAKERSEKIEDEVRQKRTKELEEGNKKLEEKYPELKTIVEEFSKFIENNWKNMDESTIKKFGELMDEMTETEGFKEAMVVLRKIVKEVGILKSLKMIKNLISTVKMCIKIHRKVRKILSEGEKYNLCANKDSCSIIANPPEEDDDFAELEEVIEKIKNALTPKNLMNILSGKTDELELEYKKMNGDSAKGEIKDVEIKDDGSIEEVWTGNYIFENNWQSFRTKVDKKLELISSEKEIAEKKVKVAIKVVDIFGNDTIKVMEVKI